MLLGEKRENKHMKNNDKFSPKTCLPNVGGKRKGMEKRKS